MIYAIRMSCEELALVGAIVACRGSVMIVAIYSRLTPRRERRVLAELLTEEERARMVYLERASAA